MLEVMNTLRRECPWDREQTFDSLRSNTIEETYELADAITDHNMEGIKEELGDLLLKLKAEGVGLLRTPFGLAWQRCKRDSALLFESKRQSV